MLGNPQKRPLYQLYPSDCGDNRYLHHGNVLFASNQATILNQHLYRIRLYASHNLDYYGKNDRIERVFHVDHDENTVEPSSIDIGQ